MGRSFSAAPAAGACRPLRAVDLPLNLSLRSCPSTVLAVEGQLRDTGAGRGAGVRGGGAGHTAEGATSILYSAQALS